ncbi:MAG: hypothetical protein EXR55_05220 [Dehalococcoidia bacterium]|nr:hypothetical protein [Dehalococcoidia bacterium]
MVTDTRATGRAGALRPVNAPVPTQVRAGPDGKPLTVRLGKTWHRVARIADRWHIGPDEWWTEQPVDRMYYTAQLEDEKQVTVFQDVLTLHWYRQRV